MAHTFKDFTLEKTLGEGSFGRTYLARHTALGFPVCLKLLLATSYKDLFKEEATLLAKVRHPYLPSLVGYWDDDMHVIALSYLKGESLEDVVKTDFVADEHICWILDRTLEALSYLHFRDADPFYDRGIIHSDVKPANILLNTGQHEAYLVDFGLACACPNGPAKGGTQLFMPPEFARGDTPLPASDLFSLGKTALYMAGGNVGQGSPPSDMHPALAKWIDRMIAHDVADRFESADEARSSLKQVRRDAFGRSATPEQWKWRNRSTP